MLVLNPLLFLAVNAYPTPKLESKEIDRVVRSFAEKNLFNGNVLVTRKGKVIFQKSYGLANMELSVPNKADLKYRIGSVTKQFTAMLIMQLKQEGKLDLNAKVTDYLPWYRKDTGSKITIHQLLNHTAGIPNYTANAAAITDIGAHRYTFQQIAEKYCSGDLEYEPGTKFKYNNSDYYLLGLVIEAITKKPFSQVLKENILDVVGMTDTGIDTPGPLLMKRVAGYVFADGKYWNAPHLDPEDTTYAAGAMYSTVGDLNRWQTALFSNKLLTKENMAILLKPGLGNYAYGFYVNAFTPPGMKTPVTAIGHNGGISGFSTSLIRFAEDDITIILTDNTTLHRRGNIEDVTVGIYSVVKAHSPSP
jgi:CubicO group peptidase (beta-lactamase class C family)